MAKKEKKQRAVLIEPPVFDDYGYAKEVLDKSGKKMKRITIGLIVAAVASVCGVPSILNIFKDNMQQGLLWDILLVVTLVGAIASYIIAGGFGVMLRALKKFAFIGWVIAPFPIDLATGLIGMVFALYAFLFIPVVFVFIHYLQNKKDHDAAKLYLSHFKG